MDILVWLTLATPILLILYLVYRVVDWIFHKITEVEDSPSALRNIEVKIPEVTHIDESEWVGDFDADVDCRKVVDAGTRVWRIYRSVDKIHWAECDPALTERAACNYADYIKRSNPEEFVRCDDPNGVILFYE